MLLSDTGSLSPDAAADDCAVVADASADTTSGAGAVEGDDDEKFDDVGSAAAIARL
jgi:hypothetical protein